MKKLNDILKIIIYVLIEFLLLFGPIANGLKGITFYYPFIFVLIGLVIVFIPYAIINKLKFNVLDLLIAIYSTIYLLNLTEPKLAVFHMFSCLSVIVIGKFYLSNKEEKKFEKTIKYSTIFPIIINIIGIFFEDFFINGFNIYPQIGDYLLTSAYRLYGTVGYPNTIALLALMELIIAIKEIKEEKIFNLIIIYICTLTLMLAVSKTIFTFFFIYLIFMLIKNKKEKIYHNTFVALLLPVMINTKLFIQCYYETNFIKFILLSTLLFGLFYFIQKALNKKYNYTFVRISIICIILIFFLFPITTKLKINAKKYNNIAILDIYNLNYYNNYIIQFDYKTNKPFYAEILMIKEGKYKLVTKQLIPQDKEQINIRFNTEDCYEYYVMRLEYNANTNIEIDNMELKYIYDKKVKDLNPSFLFFPSSYVKYYESIKIDKQSIDGRITAYQDSIDLIKEEDNNIIQGNGYNYFSETHDRHTHNKDVYSEHSYFFKILLETGLFGLSSFLLITIYLIYQFFKNIKDQEKLQTFLALIVALASILIDFTGTYYSIIIYILLLAYQVTQRGKC